MNSDRIGISVATLNYEIDRRIVESVLQSIEVLVHEKGRFAISDYKYAMGWHFFNVIIDRDLLHKLTNLLGSEFLKTKGKTLEEKLLKWISLKLKSYGCKASLDLAEKKESTKYGLF